MGDGAWKGLIRRRIWEILESRNIACQPRPVHNRIPNFKGAEQAAERLVALPVFQDAKIVKIDPDSPQAFVRVFALSSGKTIVVPRPKMADGFCSILHKSDLPPQASLSEACTHAGLKKYGRPVDLDATIKIDLMLSGCVAVCPKTGARLGKGRGYADMEYGILRQMGAVDKDVKIVTTVHDVQVVDDILAHKMAPHDVSVDYIVTPTRSVQVSDPLARPDGIFWNALTPKQLADIEILRILKERVENQIEEQVEET